ncbi:hypothetical protein MJO28_017392 [Puccinia striiformis f. sp. tritici]|nr:hypothetical protein MJO28_017392 [Puccinia striiformis f. sp. tritici]
MVKKNIQIRIRISASMTASHGSVFAVETGSTPVFGTNSFSPLVSSISRRVQAGATFLDVKVKELKSCQVNRVCVEPMKFFRQDQQQTSLIVSV